MKKHNRRERQLRKNERRKNKMQNGQPPKGTLTPLGTFTREQIEALQDQALQNSQTSRPRTLQDDLNDIDETLKQVEAKVATIIQQEANNFFSMLSTVAKQIFVDSFKVDIQGPDSMHMESIIESSFEFTKLYCQKAAGYTENFLSHFQEPEGIKKIKEELNKQRDEVLEKIKAQSIDEGSEILKTGTHKPLETIPLEEDDCPF